MGLCSSKNYDIDDDDASIVVTMKGMYGYLSSKALYPTHDKRECKWRIHMRGENTILIQSVHTGKYLQGMTPSMGFNPWVWVLHKDPCTEAVSFFSPMGQRFLEQGPMTLNMAPMKSSYAIWYVRKLKDTLY